MSINCDVFSNILKYCGVTELKRISSLSKETHSSAEPILIHTLVSWNSNLPKFYNMETDEFGHEFDNQHCNRYRIVYNSPNIEKIQNTLYDDKTYSLHLRLLHQGDENDCFNHIFKKFPQLRELSLSCGCHNVRNNLEQLSESLCGLLKLQKMYINFAKIESLPENIGRLNQLQILDVSGNHLTTFPESIGHLKQLRILRANHNHIISLPESICQLKQLRKLVINNNNLTGLPICLHELENLRKLNIGHNNFSLGSLQYIQEIARSVLRKIEVIL